jgi:AcrR family transcriptional regulator
MLGDDSTRERLLQGAREVFAKRGLKGATVRDICSRAGANVAAVSYHFGGKEKLYAEVLRDYIAQESRRHPRDAGITPASTPEERLRAFVRSMLEGALCDGEPEDERLGKLFMQEFVEPSEHFWGVFEDACRPTLDMLMGIVRELLPGADEASVAQCASSINGQCSLYRFARETIARVNPVLALTPESLGRIAEFILQFSIGGMARVSAAAQN